MLAKHHYNAMGLHKTSRSTFELPKMSTNKYHFSLETYLRLILHSCMATFGGKGPHSLYWVRYYTFSFQYRMSLVQKQNKLKQFGTSYTEEYWLLFHREKNWERERDIHFKQTVIFIDESNELACLHLCTPSTAKHSIPGWLSGEFRMVWGSSKLTATILSPYIIPSSAWGSLRSFKVILISIMIVRVVWAWESIWTWLINLPGLCFDSQYSQYKSCQLSIQHSRAIKKLQGKMS